MSFETWQTISNIATFVGVVFAGIGGFGGYYFGQRIAAQEDAQAASEQAALGAKIQTLLDGNAVLQTRLEPFEEMNRSASRGRMPTLRQPQERLTYEWLKRKYEAR